MVGEVLIGVFQGLGVALGTGSERVLLLLELVWCRVASGVGVGGIGVTTSEGRASSKVSH